MLTLAMSGDWSLRWKLQECLSHVTCQGRLLSAAAVHLSGLQNLQMLQGPLKTTLASQVPIQKVSKGTVLNEASPFCKGKRNGGVTCCMGYLDGEVGLCMWYSEVEADSWAGRFIDCISLAKIRSPRSGIL